MKKRTSKRVHWNRGFLVTACGKTITNTVRTAERPEDVDCAQCRFSWAWAVAAGCKAPKPRDYTNKEDPDA